MNYRATKKPKLILLALTTLFLFITLNASLVAFAYFSSEVYSQSKSRMDIRMIFGMLDPSLNPTGAWGSETNPYLIANNQHLINLSILQDRTDRSIINDSSVFQVSDELGRPVYIGSDDYTSMLEINSIGSERFPFTSKLSGVKTSNSDHFITLQSGEKSDTSVIGNVKVNAKPTQIDIGLFGNLGPSVQPGDGLPVGELSTLLLYNIALNTDAVGTYEASHKYFVTGGSYETNHIGILVGHAQYSSIKNISVYYSGPSTDQKQKDVQAFNIDAGTAAKYASASGIVGHYTSIVVNDNNAFPVSSTGFPDQLGGSESGLGLGVVYSEDIWRFMEENTLGGATATENEYNLQQTFGAELYGAGNTTKKYFNIGVFTFAHSKQVRSKDKISKLWATPGSNNWSISTNGNYVSSTISQAVTAKKYTTTRITNYSMEGLTTTGTNSYVYHILNSTLRNPANYRYMITFFAEGVEYALVRYGDSAIAKKVDPTNFIIPEAELKYYTFESLTTRTGDTRYPPYLAGSAYRYETPGATRFITRNVNYGQFAAYGELKMDGTDYIEAPRPLRVFLLSGNTPSTTFNASSSSSIEGLHFHPNTGVAYNANANATGQLTTNVANTNALYDTFSLERTNSTGGTPQNYYMTYTATGGFSAASGLANATPVRLYAVRISANTSNPSESPVVTNYNKTINTPSANIKTYDMRTNVLKYTGDPDVTLPTSRYKYDIQTIESLNWSNNKGEPLEEVETTLKMGNPTSYYYISGADNPYWGVATGIPSPITQGQTINVPEGSIGFTVNGTGIENSTAKVFVIVSSEPSQDFDQKITISRFGTNNNQTGDRKVVEKYAIVVPPVPGPTISDTQPIYITDNGAEYTVYPNMNTLLIAYEFIVSSQYTITYFLEASTGSANFVYLSAERIAATDNNPTHENEVYFPHLSGIDFVFKGVVDQTRLATVGSDEYVSTLTSMYFGIKANPLNPTGANPAVDAVVIPVSNGLNFTYSIGRMYNPDDEKYYLYLTILVNGYPTTITSAQKSLLIEIMNNYNFNFAEWSYLDSSTYEYAFSDVVVMTINGYTITNWVTDLKP